MSKKRTKAKTLIIAVCIACIAAVLCLLYPFGGNASPHETVDKLQIMADSKDSSKFFSICFSSQDLIASDDFTRLNKEDQLHLYILYIESSLLTNVATPIDIYDEFLLATDLHSLMDNRFLDFLRGLILVKKGQYNEAFPYLRAELLQDSPLKATMGLPVGELYWYTVQACTVLRSLGAFELLDNTFQNFWINSNDQLNRIASRYIEKPEMCFTPSTAEEQLDKAEVLLMIGEYNSANQIIQQLKTKQYEPGQFTDVMTLTEAKLAFFLKEDSSATMEIFDRVLSQHPERDEFWIGACFSAGRAADIYGQYDLADQYYDQLLKDILLVQSEENWAEPITQLVNKIREER